MTQDKHVGVLCMPVFNGGIYNVRSVFFLMCLQSPPSITSLSGCIIQSLATECNTTLRETEILSIDCQPKLTYNFRIALVQSSGPSNTLYLPS